MHTSLGSKDRYCTYRIKANGEIEMANGRAAMGRGVISIKEPKGDGLLVRLRYIRRKNRRRSRAQRWKRGVVVVVVVRSQVGGAGGSGEEEGGDSRGLSLRVERRNENNYEEGVFKD